MEECHLGFAKRGIFVPSAPTFTQIGVMNVLKSYIGNFDRASIEYEDGGSSFACNLRGNLFSSIIHGASVSDVIVKCVGFDISGNAFTDDPNYAPLGPVVDLLGSGRFSGNSIGAGVRPGRSIQPSVLYRDGTFEHSGNFIYSPLPVEIRGAALVGGGNTYRVLDPGQVAVLVPAGAAIACLDITPDNIGSFNGGTFTGNSYVVQPTSVRGTIRYSPQYDKSSDGPVSASPGVLLRNVRLQSYYLPAPKGNGAAGAETPLATPAIPAYSIDKNGKGFRFRAWGTTAANAAAKRVRIVFGAVLYDTLSPSPNNIAWEFHGAVYRTASNSQQCFVSGHYNGAVVPPQAVTTAVDLTQDQSFYIGGTGSLGPNDIVLQGFDLEVIQ